MAFRDSISFSRRARSKIPPYLLELILEMMEFFFKMRDFFFHEGVILEEILKFVIFYSFYAETLARSSDLASRIFWVTKPRTVNPPSLN